MSDRKTKAYAFFAGLSFGCCWILMYFQQPWWGLLGWIFTTALLVNAWMKRREQLRRQR